MDRLLNSFTRSGALPRLLAAAALAALASLSTAQTALSSEPLEPHEALADFQLPDGFRIELVADEPEVVDPVAMAFDARSRLWVVEMRDYPVLPEGAPPSSRIRILEDRDSDGHYEHAQTFAEGLLFPTGLQLWGSGAFVTLAGELAYFPDEDDDGRADRQETWYEGFATLNEQLRANHPTLAPDGWIYVAGGLRGGSIKNHRRPDAPPVSINGRDFAFDPRTGKCRAVTGHGQFGLTLDDFGHRFTCSNRNPLVQVMIEQHYLVRNPLLIMPRLVEDSAAAGADSRLYPRSRALTTSAQHAGQFTAACGVEIYRGDGLESAVGDAFICEPTANLVHRESLAPCGAVIAARPVEQGREFLTASDEWFRPVNLQVGPDGALYVVDMYRAVIEHPEWMPEELRRRPDMRDGADRGRIYRIVGPEALLGERRTRSLADGDPGSLARLLEHPNSWQRELGARLLVERGGADAVAALSEIAIRGRTPSARHLALATLDALDALPTELILQALSDASSGVRQRTLCLAESRLGNSPELKEAVLRRARDESPRVRFQFVLTSMFLSPEEVESALLDVALQDSADPWTCRAIALAARDRADELLVRLNATPNIPPPRIVNELFTAVVASAGVEGISSTLAELSAIGDGVTRPVLMAAAAALESRGSTLADAAAILESRSDDARRQMLAVLDEALATVLDVEAPEAQRMAAATLLQNDARPATGRRLLRLLETEESPIIQLAAIKALRQQRTTSSVPESLLKGYPDLLPSARQAAVELLTSRPEWAEVLLNAAEAGTFPLAEIGSAHRLALQQNSNERVRALAERIFGAASPDRIAIVHRYRDALALEGDVHRGKDVFVTVCANCHRIGATGTAVGPDIGDSAMKSSEQLLTDILDPNRAVDANYVSYSALTVDGLAHQGIIRSETDHGVVLVSSDGKAVTLRRDEIESLISSGSLMPEGLEQQISLQQMADLLVYLKTWRFADDAAQAKDSPSTPEADNARSDLTLSVPTAD